MACNLNRLNCTPSEIFAANANFNCNRLVTPSSLQAEQLVYDKSYQDLINSLGIKVDYYIHTFNLSGADLLYGEQPTAIYYGPVTMMMYVELNEGTLNLSKFGFDSADEFTGYIHIQSFTTATSGQYLEPKSGDLIKTISLGCDRPNGRGSKIFEVTERMDQDVASINPLLGHYVYRLRAKRYEYSFEPNAPKENVNEQIFENTFNGILSTNISNNTYIDTPSDTKSYPGDIDITSKTKVLDMDVDNTDIYGGYY